MAINKPVYLAIADISGYTRFMRAHSVASSHAREIIARLLRVMVERIDYPLRVAEIEGDAIFLFAAVEEDPTDHSAAILKGMAELFTAFHRAGFYRVSAASHSPSGEAP